MNKYLEIDNTFLNNQWFKGWILNKIKKHIEVNENKYKIPKVLEYS